MSLDLLAIIAIGIVILFISIVIQLSEKRAELAALKFAQEVEKRANERLDQVVSRYEKAAYNLPSGVKGAITYGISQASALVDNNNDTLVIETTRAANAVLEVMHSILPITKEELTREQVVSAYQTALEMQRRAFDDVKGNFLTAESESAGG